MMLPARRQLHESRHQVYRHGRAQRSDRDRSAERQWQAGDGVDRRNEGQQHSAVYPRSAGELHVTWEEGTWAAWLYDLLQPQVAQVLVCDPRRNALLKEGNKSDKIDARKLADLLRTGMLRPVYHGEHGLRTLRELGRCYQTLSQDLNRVMNRIKALDRGWSIPCAGTQVYAPRYREQWLQKIEHAGVRRRAELLYQQLDGLQMLRRTLRPELLAESRKHKAPKLLRQIPCIGPIRAARLIALVQTPHRFRSKRQLWTYSGLGIETRDSAQYRFVRRNCGSYRRDAASEEASSPPDARRFVWGGRCLQAFPQTRFWSHLQQGVRDAVWR